MMWQGSCTILQRSRHPPGPSSRTSRPRACAPSRSPSNLGCPRRALHPAESRQGPPGLAGRGLGACGCHDGGRLGVGASGRRLERRPWTAGADHVPRTRSAASGSAGPAKRGAALSRKLLAAVLTLVLAGWLLQGCAERRRNDPSYSIHIAARRRRGGLGRRRLPLGRFHRRTGSIRGRRGERPSYRPVLCRLMCDT
jgi:hypothetical protein